METVKAQNEKGRFLNHSTHNGHSFSSFYSHAHSTTVKHFQHWPLKESCPRPALLKPAYIWCRSFPPPSLTLRLACCVLSLSYLYCLYWFHIHCSVAVNAMTRLMISLSLPQALLHATCGALKSFPSPYCLRKGWIPKHSSSRQLLPSFRMDFDKFLPVA